MSGLGALVLHNTVRDALQKHGKEINGAYLAAVSDFIAPAVRDMPLDELAKRLEAKTGKPWVIIPANQRAYWGGKLHVLESHNHFLTYETKARIIVNQMQSNPVFA